MDVLGVRTAEMTTVQQLSRVQWEGEVGDVTVHILCLLPHCYRSQQQREDDEAFVHGV